MGVPAGVGCGNASSPPAVFSARAGAAPVRKGRPARSVRDGQRNVPFQPPEPRAFSVRKAPRGYGGAGGAGKRTGPAACPHSTA
ncbi:hypothetical protein D7X33_15875 [Butyricicoccus sp. 1XD8-22]|nr:hypothetical protein D7X33_15875 [Butyricicoccus sp. 1XD8-22]